jgi:uncharacterized membrane protein YgcG
MNAMIWILLGTAVLLAVIVVRTTARSRPRPKRDRTGAEGFPVFAGDTGRNDAAPDTVSDGGMSSDGGGGGGD